MAVLRIEKTGRAGKTVTVIERLPKIPRYLDDLARFLKTRCGSGGTFRIEPEGGVVEIQGDRRENVRALLAEKGIECRG
jgi:translation initiation factor 1